MGAILGFIWNAIVWVAEKAAELAVFLWEAAKQTGIQLWHAVKEAARYAAEFARWVRNGIDYLWTRYVRPIAQALWTAAEKVSAFLKRILGPVIEVLVKLQKALTWLWTNVVSPILDAIGMARRVLQLLGKLGFEWALKADAWLADLERRIIQGFGKLTGWLNEVLDFLWQITTPAGLLNPKWLFGSMAPYVSTLGRWLIQAGVETFYDEEKDRLMREYPPNTHADLDRQLATGEIRRRPVADVTHAIVERILRDKV